MFFTQAHLSTHISGTILSLCLCERLKNIKRGGYRDSHVGSMCQYQLIKLTKDCKYIFEDMWEIRGVVKL